MADIGASTSALSKSIEILNADTEGLVNRFAELSDGSKVWNIASRLLSGSGLWQLQNRIRALGNIISVFNKASAAQMENQIKAVKSAQELSKTLRDLKYEYDNIHDSDYYKATRNNLIAKGYTKEKAANMARLRVQKQYSSVITSLGRKMGSAKGGIRDFLNEGMVQEFGRFQNRDEEGNTTEGFSFRNKMTQAGMGGYTINQFARVFQKMKWTKAIITQKNFTERGKDMYSWFKEKGKKFGRFLDVGVSLFMKVLIYLGLATLVIFLLRKAFGPAKKFLEKFGGLTQEFNIFKKGLFQVLYGLKDIITGVFQGDFGKVWKGLKGILDGLWKILITSIMALGKIVVAGLLGLGSAIISGIKAKVPFFANGGISAGGMAVVGERGPELVSLPAGSRVYSNSDSRRMSGNTINVHVNGRVGASDSEIRDIADKVAREINMRMNRTTSAVSRF
jgi:hypothetical protein